MFVFNAISLICLLLVGFGGTYLWALAIASVVTPRGRVRSSPRHCFAIAIPAHNEETVIGQMVAAVRQQNYPPDKYDIFVVADHCVDRTAEEARAQGATCFEKKDGERGGKGDALRWLFEHIFDTGKSYDAVVIFDADTRVDRDFLGIISARLVEGAEVIQGRHVISNPRAGWFPALTWAMMAVDNRYSNQGRANLGLSAKHMGDSICFRSDVLKALGWGKGLTEDYEFRLRLLLEGVRIAYEPRAVGHGEAPLTWQEARAQRSRWHKGRSDARRRYGKRLLWQGIRQRDWAMLDGAIGSSMPSYSTLALVSAAMFLLHLVFSVLVWPALIYLWGGMALAWFAYPLLGLALEGAPWWAYLATLSGPVFMMWRTWLSVRSRLRGREITWVRTPHRGETPGQAGD